MWRRRGGVLFPGSHWLRRACDADTKVISSLFRGIKNDPFRCGRDNPAAITIIRSLILLGARRDARELVQEGALCRGVCAVRNASLASDTRPPHRTIPPPLAR